MLLAPLVALVVLVVGTAALRAQRLWQRRLVGRVVPEAAPAQLLVFSSPSCSVCHVAQRPIVERLRQRFPHVTAREVDITAEPEVARRFRVMSLPSTVVLHQDGRVAAVNVGLASEARLADQLTEVAAAS